MGDDLVVEAPALLVVDRSTLERFKTCPAQAQFVAGGRVITTSHAAEVGSVVHAVFGDLLTEYVTSRGNLGLVDMIETAKQLLCMSRPDLQQDALEAARASLYGFGKFIHEIHPDNVIRWDGGKLEHSGQLAWDLEDVGVRVTSEVDLLHAGRAPQIINETDWKTGRALWTVADIESAFQFQLHSWLILNNYPEVDCVSVRIWNTRWNSLTYGVNWVRDELYQLDMMIRSTVANWLKYKDVPAEQCPTWASVEKCALCDAAALCPAIPADMKVFAADPAGVVELMVAVEAKLDALKKIASGHVDRLGKDIVTESGAAFGIGKPKKERKPTKVLYSISGRDEEQ